MKDELLGKREEGSQTSWHRQPKPHNGPFSIMMSWGEKVRIITWKHHVFVFSCYEISIYMKTTWKRMLSCN